MQDNPQPYHGYGADQGVSLGAMAGDLLFSPWTLVPWGFSMQSGTGATAKLLGSNRTELAEKAKELNSPHRKISGRQHRNYMKNRKRAYKLFKQTDLNATSFKEFNKSFNTYADSDSMVSKLNKGMPKNAKKFTGSKLGAGLSEGAGRARAIGRGMKLAGYAMIGTAVIDAAFDYAKEARRKSTSGFGGYNLSHAAVHSREAMNQRQQALELVRQMPGWVQRQGSEARRFHG